MGKCSTFTTFSGACYMAVLWASSSLVCAAVIADKYPSKPIRIVVPFTPGGSNDLVGRVLAQKFQDTWGQPVIIDNRPGGGSTIGIDLVVPPHPMATPC